MTLREKIVGFLMRELGYVSFDVIRAAVDPTVQKSILKHALREMESLGEVERHTDPINLRYRLSDDVRAPRLKPVPMKDGDAILSHKRTGDRLILVDSYALREVRRHADNLKVFVEDLRIENNKLKDDLLHLIEALVSLIYMAEPEVPILEQILKSPKFRMIGAVFERVATIRSAIGI